MMCFNIYILKRTPFMPSTRPYPDCYNVESVYHSGYANTIHAELTDAEIDALIKDDDSAMLFDNDIYSELVGDAYADAILADMSSH